MSLSPIGMKINIDHTRDKLRQLGISCRLKGNDEDRQRQIAVICKRNYVEPVFEQTSQNT